MEAVLIDTNLLVRFLTGDDMAKAKKVKLLFESKNEKIIIPEIVIAELVWILGSFYKLKKTEIVPKILAIINAEAVSCNKELLSAALNTWNCENIDYIDAYLIVLAGEIGTSKIYSYDKKMAAIAGVINVVEP